MPGPRRNFLGIRMNRIEKRVVLHFPGFEPLDAAMHRARYERSARQSAKAWDYSIETGPLQKDDSGEHFDVRAGGAGWQSASRVHLFDHNDLVSVFNAGGFFARLARGYAASVSVAASGGLTGYFRHAWRFGLFFVFPFLLMAAGMAVSLAIALAPWIAGLSLWHLCWSLPLAAFVFVRGFLPRAERLHTLHLFGNWRMAAAMAALDRKDVEAWLERSADAARHALNEPADEYVISSHSMGANMAAHVVGLLLEREPHLFEGKRVAFVTLGGAIPQCALLKPASVLRARVGLIARCPWIDWLDVQCLTDPIHFYKVRIAALCGHEDARQADILYVRFKTMLSGEHYARIRRDFLRVHRQYVLGPDKRASYDFTLMTAGPWPASDFAPAGITELPAEQALAS